MSILFCRVAFFIQKHVFSFNDAGLLCKGFIFIRDPCDNCTTILRYYETVSTRLKHAYPSAYN